MKSALETVVKFGELIKDEGNWHFSANSAGFPDGLRGLCQQYGVSV
jgi:stress response protein SCP2